MARVASETPVHPGPEIWKLEGTPKDCRAEGKTAVELSTWW